MREVSGVSVGDFLVFFGGIGEDGLSQFRSGAAFPDGLGQKKIPPAGPLPKGWGRALAGGRMGKSGCWFRGLYCKRARRAADSAS